MTLELFRSLARPRFYRLLDDEKLPGFVLCIIVGHPNYFRMWKNGFQIRKPWRSNPLTLPFSLKGTSHIPTKVQMNMEISPVPNIPSPSDVQISLHIFRCSSTLQNKRCKHTRLGGFSLSCFFPLSSLALCAEALTSHFAGWSVFPGGEFGLGPDKKCSVPAG